MVLFSPRSCDTFVVLTNKTKNKNVIFGKNSDRPQKEVQEVVFYRSRQQENKLKIADCKEAWVLETSGKLWAAEKIECCYRNISNCLSITTKIDKHSEGLHEKAIKMRLCDGKGEFNFSPSFSLGGDEMRYQEGARLLKDSTVNANFVEQDMFKILRHKESGICRSCGDMFPTQGSQAPQEHHLYSLHQKIISMINDNTILEKMHALEKQMLEKVRGQDSLEVLEDIFKESVNAEVQLYERNTF